ncbi:MAG: Rho termination factor N-terminal domain-containing protein [Clostridia bacterium]|nr:Rho termination factor N-terminal domain-containing protein [Clostridia bacterium]
MYILNKKTGLIHSCTNKDALKSFRKDENYLVAETKAELMPKEAAEPAQEPQEAEKTEEAEEVPAEEEKTAEEPAEAAEEAPEEEAEPQEDEDLTAKTVKELREIAKALGITGTANMNKDTLVAMIMDAEEG